MNGTARTGIIKMKKILYYLVVIVTVSFVAVSCKKSCCPDQAVALRKVTVLKITNENLLPILDSIIQHEKKCVYYSSDLVFSIDRQAVNDSIAEFEIGGIGSLLVDLGEDYYKGCFEYEGHWFLVTGKELDKTVFANADYKKEFVFYKTGWVTDEGEIVLIDFEDDRYSYWIYHYNGEVFKFKNSSDTYCNCNDF